MSAPKRRISLAVIASAVAILAFSGPASAGISMLGWWPLAEGQGQIAHDFSGRGNNGTLGSTAGPDANDPTWVKGIFGGAALSFDGNDYVQIPSSTALESQHLTVSMWVKASQTPGPYRYLISKGGNACISSSWAITTSFNGGLIFYIWNGEQQRNSGLATPAMVWDGRWHHVAGTYDGVTVKLFIDGKELPHGSDLPVTIDYSVPVTDSALGAYRGTCDLMFAGSLDQVMVLSEALPIDKIWKTWGWILGSPTIQ